MLSPWAVVVLTWAAVQAYAGTHILLLYLRRRSQSEHLAFSGVCFATAVHDVATAVLVDTTSPSMATLALQVELLSLLAAGGCFVAFLERLGSRARPRLLRGVLAWLIGMALLVLAGLAVDGREPLLPRPVGPTRTILEPPLTPVGVALVIASCAVVGGATMVVASTIRGGRTTWVLGLGVALSFGGAIHDEVVRTLRLPTPYLLEHLSVLGLLLVSLLLILRVLESEEELEARTVELRQSHDALREAERFRIRQDQLAAFGELSAVIAHEVRNPLAVIKNAVSTLRRPSLAASDGEVLLGILDEEVDRLERLARDLWAYARPVEPRGQRLLLAPLLRTSVDAVQRQHAAGPSVRLDVDPSCGTGVHADPELLRQAFVHVIDNAFQALDVDGGLVVGCDCSDSARVVLTFRDDGPGMEANVRTKAVDPFFTTRSAGTGLGLAIVERVVRNHGGALRIDSARGEGTTVTIELPRPGASAEAQEPSR
ncbi:MAG: nitrogen regulation protein NR(II) [Sandaracinaceae bacterium]